MHTLTIIIPSFNHEKYILSCLTAVSSVNIKSKRIIVIDDESTDGTVQVVKDFISNGNNDVELICKKNSGIVHSLNLGLKKASSEFVYVVASDDIPNAEGIETAVNYLCININCQFFVGGGNNFFEDGRPNTPIYGHKHEIFFNLTEKRRNREIFLNYPTPLLLQSIVFRLSALNAVGGWDSRLILDDYPLFVNMLKKFPDINKDFIFMPQTRVVMYRHHGTNSYKKIAKQFYMVYQAMNLLAPAELKNKAIGKYLAYYTMLAVRAFNIKSVIEMILLTPKASYPYALTYIPILLMAKFKNKIT